MSNSDYNKIISTINSVSRDYTYSPDPNNLICIDTSNNRIGINTLDPQESLHISGGNILVKTIRAERIFYDYIYANQGSSSVVGDSTISVSSVSATSSITAPLVSATSSITAPLVTATSSITAPLVTATNIRVTNNIDISRGRITANNIDISSILDISNGRIIANNIDVSAIYAKAIDISRGRIIANFIDVSSTLDISRGRIIANNIDVSSTLDISRGRIIANFIDVSSVLDISRGRIIANNIDVSSVLDISRGRIIVNNIDVSSVLDISRGRIIANFIDVSSTIDISRGRIRANFIDVSSTLDISRGRIIANFIDVSSTLDISRGRIIANNIDVSSTLDISRGLILANTISGSAITINLNANASSDVITINIGNSTGVNIITSANSNGNTITINGSRVATTQHIKNTIPYGVIMAYYSTPAPPGWAICNGSNGTPDLRGRFILGAGSGSGLTNRVINVSGGEENVTLNLTQIPSHNHTTYFKYFAAYYTGASYSYFNLPRIDADVAPSAFTSTSTGGGAGGVTDAHNNMPPFYVLVYIMKTDVYDFCYNVVVNVPSAPNFTAVQSGLTSVIVNWSVPSNIGGSAINSYSILMNDINQTNPSASTFTYTKTGLTSGQTYVFKVTATNTQGTSLSISPISITMATLPSAPTISISSYAASGYYSDHQPPESYDVTISWSHPANGGSPITAYNMYVNGSSTPIVITASSISTIINLLANIANSITMKSQTAIGLSSASNTLEFSVFN